MLGRRWELADGVLLSGLEITHDDRAMWLDVDDRLSGKEVVDALRDGLSLDFQTTEGDRIVEIAREVDGRGPIASIDRGEAMEVIEAALRDGRLVARRKKKRKEPARKISTLFLMGNQGPKMSLPAGADPDAAADGEDAEDDTLLIPTADDPDYRRVALTGVNDFLQHLDKKSSGDWRWDIRKADTKVFKNAEDVRVALGQHKYERVVVYSHGNPYALLAILDKRNWVIPGAEVNAAEFGRMLKAAGVRRALILGCDSKDFAKTAAEAAEGGVVVAGIDTKRKDYLETTGGNHPEPKLLNILPLIIWPFGREGGK